MMTSAPGIIVRTGRREANLVCISAHVARWSATTQIRILLCGV
jgi:hypothetical protein